VEPNVKDQEVVKDVVVNLVNLILEDVLLDVYVEMLKEDNWKQDILYLKMYFIISIILMEDLELKQKEVTEEELLDLDLIKEFNKLEEDLC